MKDKKKAGKIIFVSSNQDKIKEISLILSKFNIAVEGEKFEFDEIADARLENIVVNKARHIMDSISQPFIVDDSGIFFNAYPDFPGVFTKHIFKSLGYEGILRLLKNKNRQAYFKAVIAYVDAERRILLFDGLCRGHISDKIKGPLSPASPFNRLFIPHSQKKTFAQMGLDEQRKISHRAKALTKFVKVFLNSKKRS